MGKLTKFQSLCGERQLKMYHRIKERRNPCKHIAVNTEQRV